MKELKLNMEGAVTKLSKTEVLYLNAICKKLNGEQLEGFDDLVQEITEANAKIKAERLKNQYESTVKYLANLEARLNETE